MQLTYVALDERGREVVGSLKAVDPAGGAADLRSRGLFPVEVQASASAPTSSGFAWPGVVRTADVVLFCNQLALMLRTGLTLLQALETLAERASKRRLRHVAAALAADVEAGSSLSDAVAAQPVFPPLVAHLVRTAEVTGELDLAFDRAATYLERRAELRFQVLTSLTYPAIVVLVSLGVFWFLTANVVPKIARFLAGRGVELPWTTQLLLDLSEFLQAYGPAILGGGAALAVGLLVLYRTPRGRLLCDRVALSVPVVGGVLRTAALAHLSRTLGLLLESGLPLLESLRILAGTFSNRIYTQNLEQAADRVIQGTGLAESLQGPGISPLCTQVLGVGEQTGATGPVLDELATFYDKRLQRLLKTLAGLIEPALLLIVGGMVGLVYLSFFQAVFQLASR